MRNHAKNGAILIDCFFLSQKNSDNQQITATSVPMQPSGTHLQSLQGKQIKNITCGSDKTLCITNGDTVGRTIGLTLLQDIDLMSGISEKDDFEVCQ